MKNNRYDIEMLSAYLDGELSPKEKKFIEQKIKSSIELQNKLNEIKALKSLTQDAKPQLDDSVYFEAKLFAELKSHNNPSQRFKKLIPVFSFTGLVVALIFVLSFNPSFIKELWEKQETNLVEFYKSNLKPLLYAANLTAEDVFNFALNEELPLDPSKSQTLKLGYDKSGKEFFEIKKNPSKKSENNLKNFITALELNENEQKQMDSLLSVYTDKISSQILVSDKNAIAINPNLWNVRKAVLADLLSFAQKHGNENFLRTIKVNEAPQIDKNIVWIEKVKTLSPKDFIICTPDSVFSAEIDIASVDKQLLEAKEELKKVNQQLKKQFYFSFNIKKDSLDLSKNSKIKTDKNFKVLVNNDGVQVQIEDFQIPDINIPDINEVASIIEEASRNNLKVVKLGAPEISPEKTIRFNNKDVIIDSVIEQNNKVNELNRKRIDEMKIHSNNSASDEIKEMIDSLLIKHNQELRLQIEQLRKEIEKFRQDMQNLKNQEQIDKYEEMIKKLEEQIEI